MIKHKLFIGLTIVFLLTQCFPPSNLLIPIGAAEKLAFFVGGTILLFPSLLTKTSIKWLIVYGIMTFIYYIVGNAFLDSFNSVIIPFLGMMASLLMTEYALTYDNDYRYSRLVSLIVITLDVFMALLTIPQIMINPNIVRSFDILITEEGAFGTTLSYWITSYHTIHGLPCIIAPLFFICRKIRRINKKFFYFFLLSIVILYYLIFIANAVTAFLISTIMLILALLFYFEEFNGKSIITMAIIGVLFLPLTSPTVSIPVIDTVQSVMNPGGFTYVRLDEIKETIIYGESTGDLAARQELYGKSEDLFWESPIWGTDHPERIAHHSWVRDRLACFGMIFFIPLALIFVFHIKSVYRNLKHTHVVYAFGASAYLLMLYLKNSFGMGTWLYAFAVLPLLCRYTDSLIERFGNKGQAA